MKWIRNPRRRGVNALSAFTLVELLAAMVFMGIVIPVAVQGLRIATRAGEVGQRKAVAARVLDRVMNEYVAMNSGTTTTGKLNGTETEGSLDYRWKIKLEGWREDSVMRTVTCEVTYPVQGKDYSVTATTLVPLVTK